MPKRPRRWLRFINSASSSAADPRVRLAAIWATAGLTPAEAEVALRPLMDGEDLRFASRAAAQMDGRDPRFVSRAAALLAERGDVRQLDDRVVEFLTHDDLLGPRISLGVARDGEWGGLRDALSGPSEVQQAAAWVAASTGERAAVRVLADKLFDPDPQLRKAAIWGIHRANAKRYLPEVRFLAADRDHEVRARVDKINGFSGHTDRTGLLRWLGNLQSPPKQVFLTHGDEEASQSLAEHIAEQFKWPVTIPDYQDAVELR